jgi:predicted ATPase with chaperone activity
MTTTATPSTDLDHLEPITLWDLGIDPAMVRDLTLKTMFYGGRFTRAELAEALRVSVAIVEELLHTITRDGLANVLASDSVNVSAHAYTLTQQGYLRAEEALARNSYVGPVPVPLAAYIRQTRAQSIDNLDLARDNFERALDALVLSPITVRRAAWAVASRKPLLIHGSSGNGKTTLARAIGAAVGGTIRIPYAVEMVGQIVRVYDESKHQSAEPAETFDPEASLARTRGDRRWIRVHRPMVWAGGELTKYSVELSYDTDTRIYEAPLQLKANGGVLVIDDLGRQQLPAVQLLNRWIVALESRADHLTLHTGQMVEVPFDVMLIFSTNLPPEDMADEAFLRRIRYKIHVDNPTPEEYRRIFVRECAARNFTGAEAAVEHVLARWYADGRALRGCHPRDLLDAAVDCSGHDGRAPLPLTHDIIDEACATYFL